MNRKENRRSKSLGEDKINSEVSAKFLGSYLTGIFALVVALTAFNSEDSSAAPKRTRPSAAPKTTAPSGVVYQEFRGPNGAVIHWLADQMPLKVYIAPGTSLDSIIDPALGAPATSTGNLDHLPDLVASVIQNPEQMQNLQPAVGYVPEHYQAALEGINSWLQVAHGAYSYQIVQDPSDADIYVFWTNHFVNKLGLALFENDIRGYTAKRSFPLAAVQAAVQAGRQIDFKPVVTLLRTTEASGLPMPVAKLRASAAHEFGHALGIEGHSRNPNDLMSVFYGHGSISAGDAATINYLYKLSPNYIP